MEALGQTSKTAYARYEQGQSVPTMQKFEELLRAVSPDASIVIGVRSSAKPPAPREKPTHKPVKVPTVRISR